MTNAPELLPLREAHGRLGITFEQLRTMIRKGAPVAYPGHSGAGGRTLVDIEAVAAWLAARRAAARAAPPRKRPRRRKWFR
jgi:hypothetical protein